MIKFTEFTSGLGETPISKQINDWLTEEKPKAILTSNLQVVGSGLSTTHVMTIFYESNPAVEYTKPTHDQSVKSLDELLTHSTLVRHQP